MPDKELSPQDDYVYVPLRGYTTFLAAFQDYQCVGWVDVRAWGYETVAEYKWAENWKDIGY